MPRPRSDSHAIKHQVDIPTPAAAQHTEPAPAGARPLAVASRAEPADGAAPAAEGGGPSVGDRIACGILGAGAGALVGGLLNPVVADWLWALTIHVDREDVVG